MINIYPADAYDFSTLGLAVLQPAECFIEEKAGGLLELEMKHPVDDDLRWTYLQNGCIIKAPCAVREAPIVRILDNVQSGTTQTVTRAIYKVRTNTGARLRLRAKASTSSKILGSYKSGTEVVQLSTSGDWSRVIIKRGGATGWMSSQYLTFVRNETETVSGDRDNPSSIIESMQTRDQLFRIYSVSHDAETGMVEVIASHIFYDLSGVICTKDYHPENVAANTVLDTILANASNTHGFDFHCTVKKAISGDYTGVSLVKALLDPDIGIVPLTGARIIRDNYDVYILPDEVTDRGMEVRHRKNLLGATLTVDVSGTVTRIRPVGKDKDGNRLLITENNGWVQSANISLYPTSRDVEIAYDVSVSTDKDAQFKTNAAARNELKRLAQQDFDNGMDAAKVSLDVQLAALENSAEYADYAPLLTMFLYDTVHVIATYVGIDAKLRVNGYVYDCLMKRYHDVYVGDISDLEQTTYGYEIANGSVSGVKILPGSVNANTVMRKATIGYALIAHATVEQLNANAITAVTGRFNSVTADSVETDELYAAVAHVVALAADSIRAGKIDADALAAALAEIVVLRAETIQAENITTDELAAAVARIVALRADAITAGSIETDELGAALAKVIALYAQVGEFDFVASKNLVSGALSVEEASADSVYITNLAVTNANLLSATLGKLVLKGEDGKYYEIVVGADGQISTREVTVSEGEIAAGETAGGRQIVETSANIGDLNAQSIKGNQAIINTILTTALTAEKITAADAMIASATIPALYATSIQAIGSSLDLRANESVKLAVGDAVDGVDERINGVYSEVTQRADGLEAQLIEKVDGGTLRAYIRYDGENVEIGRSDSRYRTQTSDRGFVILQDGAEMTSMEQNAVTAPVFRARRTIEIGGHVMKLGSAGHLIIN